MIPRISRSRETNDGFSTNTGLKQMVKYGLVTLCLLSPVHEDPEVWRMGQRQAASDRTTFDEIVAYWRKAFPGNSFKGMRVRMVDGPKTRPRCHIPVPK